MLEDSSSPTALFALGLDHCVILSLLLKHDKALSTFSALDIIFSCPILFHSHFLIIATLRRVKGPNISLSRCPSWGHSSLFILELTKNTVLLWGSWRKPSREGEMRETPRDREREKQRLSPAALPFLPIYKKNKNNKTNNLFLASSISSPRHPPSHAPDFHHEISHMKQWTLVQGHASFHL